MNDAREAAPATGARPPAAHSPWRLGWHTGYYVLVVLNLATLSLGLYQNHRIVTRNKQSAVFNQQWAERLDSYGALARLAAAVNAPGNDVFATKDVEGEAARLDVARRRFEEACAAAVADLRAHDDPELAAPILTGLERTAATMQGMVSDAEAIFASFRQGRPDTAGERMAQMDRTYADVRAALDGLARDGRQIQKRDLARQASMAAAHEADEFALAMVILLLVVAVTAYGSQLARRLESYERERERFLTLSRRHSEELEARVEASTRDLKQALLHESELAARSAKAYEVVRVTQAELVRSERLAAVGEIAATVAHGLRNPLASIRAAAEVGLEDLPEHSPARESLADIVKEVSRLEHRIAGVLDFARPFKPTIATADLNGFVAAFVADLGRRIPEATRLVLELAPEIPPTDFDAAHLREALDALVLNAVEAAGAGGQVTIRSSLESGRNGGGSVVLSVSNTGPGIEPDQVDRIFGLFYTTKPSGTGVGLAVARRLVEAQGGRLNVTSQPADTTFRISLPLPRTPLAEAAGGPAAG